MNIARIVLCLTAAVLAASAQTLERQPNGDLELTSGVVPIVALQFDFPAGLTVSAGAALVDAGKDLTCDAMTNRCVVAGLNQIPIPDGSHIATLSGPGLPSAVLGTDAAATTGLGIVVMEIFSPCDLTQDGVIDALDLLNVVTKILDGTPCGPADLDGDGSCLVPDAQRIANAADAAAPPGVCVEG